MKRRTLFKQLIALVAVGMAFASCDNDEGIDIASLNGTWHREWKEEGLAVDGSITYTFNSDRSYDVRVYDALSDEETTESGELFVVSADNRLLTLYPDGEDESYGNWMQYEIVKLTASEMILWQQYLPKYDSETGEKILSHFSKVK